MTKLLKTLKNEPQLIKKTISYVKTHGTVSTLNKIKSFLELNNSNFSYKIEKKRLNVCLLVPGGKEKNESSSHIRLYNPLKLLENKLNIVTMPNNYKLESLKEFDICILQRNAIDNLEKANKLVSIIKKNKIKLVIDIDDAFGITTKHKNNNYMKKMHTVMSYLMDNADMIWFSTDNLSTFYNNKKCPNQYVLPNALDSKIWEKDKLKKKSESKKVRFMYMGTSTHDDDFYDLLYPAFKKLNEKYSDKFELTIIGALKESPKDKWVNTVELPNGFLKYPDFVKWFISNSDYDIGLSPLIDNDFNQCKTDIKFLDYLGVGCLPMLSEIKAYDNPKVIEHSLIVNNDKWYEELEKVILNPKIIDEKMNQNYNKYLWGDRSLEKNSNFIYEKLSNLISPKYEKIDCLVSCWLSVDDILLDGFEELEKSFHRKGINLSFLVSGKVVEERLKQNTKSKVEFCPAIISRMEINEDYSDYEMDKSKLKKLLDLDSLWTNKVQDPKKISAAYNYWKMYLINHQTKHVLIWGNTAPVSQLLILLCQELEIEYTVMERGHFSGTLLSDSIGQFGFGTKQKQLENNKISLLSDEYKKNRMIEIKDWINKDIEAKLLDTNKDELDERNKIEKKKKGKKIVLLLGANDFGAGMKKLDSSAKVNTWFKNTQDALDNLVEVLSNRFEDVLLIVKPHPSSLLKISEKYSEENYLFINKLSVAEIIKLSDVCVTTTSTVLAYCIALDKPTLQFGITDSSNSKELYDIWHPSVISSYLRDALDEQFHIEKNEHYSEYILNLFDSHLIKVKEDIPTELNIESLSTHLFNRIYKSTNSYEYKIVNHSNQVSKELYEDISTRDRKYYDLNHIEDIDEKDLPKLAIVIPVYDDFKGLKRCLEGTLKYKKVNNNYDIVMVWDCGPNQDILNYCREIKEEYNIDLVENRVNIGFSGTVNKGILKYKEHDIILLNSDTIIYSDWALRMQKAAYVDKEIGSVNPLSNNATLNNVPFPNGVPFPENPVLFVEHIDKIAKEKLKVAVEAPVSHGFCVFIKRSIIDIIGLFDEQKFGRGHSEDNEYSMRIRSRGFKCITTTNVFIGHDGGTSFKEDSEPWKINGRKIMKDEFPYYFDEIRLFFHNDPIKKERKILEVEIEKFSTSN